MNGAPSFVITLGLDPALQATLERERRRHFPEERNLVPAHVSLFHYIPADAEADMMATLDQICAITPPFPVGITGVMSLGKGTAYRVEADGSLRTHLARAWHGMLRAQDRQPWRPHVTIQNKVEPAAARALQAMLANGFMPLQGRAESVLVWRYLNGPWELADTVGLKG